MKCNLALVLPLGLHIGLVGANVLSTTTTETTTSSPPLLTARADSIADAFADVIGDTCGFVGGGQSHPNHLILGRTNVFVDAAITCASGSCAYISRYSWDMAYAACCAEDGCIAQTTCIERGTSASNATLVW